MSAEIIHNGVPQANHLHIENAEVLVPMMGNHYVDTKVRSPLTRFLLFFGLVTIVLNVVW